MEDSIRIADFFCGIGGIRLGFEQSSDVYKCVFSNDIDTRAVQTYELNFPTHKVNTNSISELKDIPDFDIFLGGFPCQPFSVAGNLKGFEDERGNLFFDIVRILREKKPKAFVLENVKNLKTHNNGQTYNRIKEELIQCGYRFKSKVLNSCLHSNTPQNRERIFLVGFLDPKLTEKFTFPRKMVMRRTKQIADILEKDVSNKYYYKETDKIYSILAEHVTEQNTVYQFRRHYVRKNMSGVCPTLTANMGGGGHNVPIILDNRGIRKLTPRECLSLQGFPCTYKLPPLADSHLYKQIGNSVTVPIIRRIATQILAVMNQLDT